jgi:hypothetical protein
VSRRRTFSALGRRSRRLTSTSGCWGKAGRGQFSGRKKTRHKHWTIPTTSWEFEYPSQKMIPSRKRGNCAPDSCSWRDWMVKMVSACQHSKSMKMLLSDCWTLLFRVFIALWAQACIISNFCPDSKRVAVRKPRAPPAALVHGSQA